MRQDLVAIPQAVLQFVERVDGLEHRRAAGRVGRVGCPAATGGLDRFTPGIRVRRVAEVDEQRLVLHLLVHPLAAGPALAQVARRRPRRPSPGAGRRHRRSIRLLRDRALDQQSMTRGRQHAYTRKHAQNLSRKGWEVKPARPFPDCPSSTHGVRLPRSLTPRAQRRTIVHSATHPGTRPRTRAVRSTPDDNGPLARRRD